MTELEYAQALYGVSSLSDFDDEQYDEFFEMWESYPDKRED